MAFDQAFRRVAQLAADMGAGHKEYFTILGDGVEVSFDDEETLRKVTHDVRPGFDSVEPNQLVCRIAAISHVDADPEVVHLLEAHGEQVTVLNFKEHHTALTLTDGERRLMFLQTNRALVAMDRGSGDVVISGGGIPIVTALLMKDILRGAVASRALQMHASAIAADNEAIMFIGPKGAGKTTSALGFANAGVGKYVANDRVVLTVPDGGRPQLWPWPNKIAVAEGTLSGLGLLGSNGEPSGVDIHGRRPYDGKWMVATSRAQAWIGDPLGGSVAVRALVFPQGQSKVS